MPLNESESLFWSRTTKTDRSAVQRYTHAFCSEQFTIFFKKKKKNYLRHRVYIKGVRMAEGGEKEDTGQFSEEYFTHVLSEGEEDYDDYTEQDLLEHP